MAREKEPQNMRVNFIRKPSGRQDLVPQDEFVIEKTIHLNSQRFEEFLDSPLADQDFIEENAKLMRFDEKAGRYHCIFVTTTNIDFGILVESEGSGYGRYCAYLPKSLISR